MSHCACVATICIANTALFGFSDPHQKHDVDEKASLQQPHVERVLATIANPPLMSEINESNKPIKPIRPSSFAVEKHPESAFLDPASGGVNSKAWFPSVSSSTAGHFHGVGFPDIRTYPRAKRSPFAAPGPWAPLVVWRTLQGDQATVEPIAKVRCMGLTPKAVALRADRYREMIYALSDQYDINAQLIKAVITEESCFNNKALSKVGAQGLMQLMPDTASWLKVNDPHDPAQNLRAGVRYLAALHKEFESLELALAAYNAGPGNVRRYKGVPPFAETQAYISKVQANYRRYKAAHRMLNAVEESVIESNEFPTEEVIEQARIDSVGP